MSCGSSCQFLNEIQLAYLPICIGEVEGDGEVDPGRFGRDLRFSEELIRTKPENSFENAGPCIRQECAHFRQFFVRRIFLQNV